MAKDTHDTTADREPASVRDTAENMVLRTVYLPKEVDNILRDLAFRDRISKGEVIRGILIQYLSAQPEAPSKPAEDKAAVVTGKFVTLRKAVAKPKAASRPKVAVAD